MRSIRTLVAALAVLGAVAAAPSIAQAEVSATLNNDVGYQKRLETTATLYTDGSLFADSYAKNNNWFTGMRPRTLVVALDGAGRKIWVSQSFNHATLCGVLDPSCASWRRETFMEDWPEVVHNHTARLVIYHADGANYVDLRNRTIDTIKAAREIAAEIKAVLDQLTKS